MKKLELHTKRNIVGGSKCKEVIMNIVVYKKYRYSEYFLRI